MMPMNRREALRVLGTTAGAGVAAAFGTRLAAAANQARAAGNNAVIRTLLKDLPPSALTSPILFHEHLSIRYPLTRAMAEQQGRPVQASFTDEVDVMIEETKAAG